MHLSVVRIRCGDSKIIKVRFSSEIAENHLSLAFDLLGGNPRKIKDEVSMADMDRAAVIALGPGTVWTLRPVERTARTNFSPGSERRGVPASETSASELPLFRCRSKVADFLISLCSWRLVRRVGMA